jgi:hypothetical protein
VAQGILIGHEPRRSARLVLDETGINEKS